ncbi:thermonuclease family protein [Mycoplasma sp. Mirounga ES2805-ORL]|uniref:thermonuclease family protein n=1 Tax=Mycoplasma sp. Mirounga ES2805-ORL TaxID=754514 RepID=UPI00197C03A4|nr:thermonuclease family protein [Mycoplasma sp. Mirounga ES2805-ORL]QSF13883.1 thermonuclease family protein [Mycoplasma sp. Mirounga ES2805-ORL]
MNKSKKYLILSGSLLPVLATPIISMSCNNGGSEKEEETKESLFKKIHEQILDKTAKLEKVNKLDSSLPDVNVKGYKLTKEEKSELEKVMRSISEKYLVPKTKNGYSLDKQYYADESIIEGNPSILVNDKILFNLDRMSIDHKFDKDYEFKKSEKLNITRTIEFKIYYKTGQNDWLYLINIPTKKIQLNFNIEMPSIDSINDVLIDYSKAKPIKVDWTKIDPKYYFDAKIIKWSDGDTFEMKIVSVPDENNFYKPIGYEGKVRFLGIDTPEKHVGNVDATKFERQFAFKSSSFGEKNFPVGTVVRIFRRGDLDTYGRITGDIIFKGPKSKDYEYFYSSEIVRKGLTLPYGQMPLIDELKNNGSYVHYAYIEIAKSMLEAQTNKSGFFKYFNTPEGVSRNIYIIKNNSNFDIFYKYNKDIDKTIWKYEDVSYPN